MKSPVASFTFRQVVRHFPVRDALRLMQLSALIASYVSLLPISLLLCLTLPLSAAAQKKSSTASLSSLCTQDYAVDTVQQTAVATRIFDSAVQRITVLVRTADLLWPYQQDKALLAFMEAFDLARQSFKDTGDETRRVSQSRFAEIIQVPDQRYQVISALVSGGLEGHLGAAWAPTE